MNEYGFVRIAAASPLVRPGDVAYNREQIISVCEELASQHVDVTIFPELTLTGYTCHDLFHQDILLRSVELALLELQRRSEKNEFGLVCVGLPLHIEGALYNTIAVISRGKILGIVPKTYLPNYKEFYDARYFASARTLSATDVMIAGQHVPVGADLLFSADDFSDLTIGIEICEDLWMPLAPSSMQAISGATILLNASASNEVIGKSAYRKQLVATQSARCIAAYAYAGAGCGESTTDLVFGGHSLIAEYGTISVESKRFLRRNQYIICDIDHDKLLHERMTTNSFHAHQKSVFRRVPFQIGELKIGSSQLLRYIDPHPFVPSDTTQLAERCEEIFQAQITALAKRLETIGCPQVAIGVSGGLDSTLALLVVAKTFDILNISRDNILGLSMPGFGTTSRTYNNSIRLMDFLNTSSRIADICHATISMLHSIGHKPFGLDIDDATLENFKLLLSQLPADKRHDLTFENTQARVRTSMLMNTAFTIGTGDLSETALGWCTYNADHMSMYNPNIGIPKTLVKFLVRWVAMNEFDGEVRDLLLDIVDTPISPELLPTDAASTSMQSTEATIGPYELHDFFLYHMIRFGTRPRKILYLAERAKFDVAYNSDELRSWLKVFLKRFASSQFKRSAMPDGPKIGSVSLSPRGDWRMPSDGDMSLWLNDLN